ncbi:hypothetical protein [Nostoc sp.]|uniref:hypothetical protein n=1 Tax=Nostoc sp. TaxID=1180 RepID=UPI002FFD1ECF
MLVPVSTAAVVAESIHRCSRLRFLAPTVLLVQHLGLSRNITSCPYWVNCTGKRDSDAYGRVKSYAVKNFHNISAGDACGCKLRTGNFPLYETLNAIA